MMILKQLKVNFSGRTLFENLSWPIPAGSRIGLVGDNGAGKTTLFRIIARKLEPDGGEVRLPLNKKIGYLPQDLVVLSDYILEDYLKEISGIVQLEQKMKNIQEMLSKTNEQDSDDPKLYRQFDQVIHQFELIGGYDFKARARRVVQGLGFTQQDWLKPCSSFSGGWKMRVILAGLLLSLPDILLLDEPTNHMDTESLEWLEGWLKNYRGTLVVISHDRYFLDKVVQEIVELENGKIKSFKGNYSFYLGEKEKQREIQEKNQKHLREKREHLEKFIERFRYKATKASQVQSRIKMLEKIGTVTEQTSLHHVHFSFLPVSRSGEEVVVLENVSHGYQDYFVFDKINMTIHRGEKVALVGVNGSGKSTLSRIISGNESPDKGFIQWGYRVKIGFFSQESAQNLNYRHSVWEEVDRDGQKLDDRAKRDLLGSFLFTGDNIYKSVHHLSGGEKSRLALAKLMLDDYNFLVLDEPGNHLDIKTKGIFHKALEEFQGTVLLVSHDRFFLDQLANRVIEIRGGNIYSYPGNYSYFIQKRQMMLEKEESERLLARESKQENRPSLIEKQKKRAQAEQRNQQYRMVKKIEEKLDPLEEEIHQLEKQKMKIEEKLCLPDILQNSEQVKSLMIELHQVNQELESLTKHWEDLMHKKEKILNIAVQDQNTSLGSSRLID